MADQQPEALRLADDLDANGWIVATPRWCIDAAAELRRLHEENSKLRREVAAISANAVDDGRAISRLEAQLGEAVWNYGEVKRVNAQLLEALEFIPASGSMLGAQAEAKRIAAITAAKGEA